MRYLSKEIILPTSAIAILLIIWEILVHLFNISKIVIPGPSDICESFILNFDQLFFSSMYTLWIAFAGLVIGFIFAIMLSTIFQFSRFIKIAFYPLAISTRAIPIIALAPLAVLWFDTGDIYEIFLTVVITIFPILINHMRGLNELEEEESDLLKIFTNSKWKIFIKVRMPKSLPYLFAGLKIASSFAVIGAIVAEFIGSNKGIGYIIKSSTYYTDTPLTFAAIIFAAVIGLSFYGAIALLEKEIIFWKREQ